MSNVWEMKGLATRKQTITVDRFVDGQWVEVPVEITTLTEDAEAMMEAIYAFEYEAGLDADEFEEYRAFMTA